MDQSVRFCLAACTDKGKTRAVNQDALLLQQALCGRKRYVLAAVCDGMGGLEKGELASSEELRSLGGLVSEPLSGGTYGRISGTGAFGRLEKSGTYGK